MTNFKVQVHKWEKGLGIEMDHKALNYLGFKDDSMKMAIGVILNANREVVLSNQLGQRQYPLHFHHRSKARGMTYPYIVRDVPVDSLPLFGTVELHPYDNEFGGFSVQLPEVFELPLMRLRDIDIYDHREITKEQMRVRLRSAFEALDGNMYQVRCRMSLLWSEAKKHIDWSDYLALLDELKVYNNSAKACNSQV